jgi:glutathione S-transferase
MFSDMSAAAEPRLVTISLSPFNELARWSLERAGIAYREEPNALVWHLIASRRAGGKGTTPVLVTDDEVIGESAEIAEWAARHTAPGRELLPAGSAGEEARRLMWRYAEKLGPESRRVIWGHLLNDVPMASRYWGQRVSAFQRRTQPLLLQLARRGVKRAIGLSRPEVAAAPGEVRAIFDEVAARLADGRRHLMGDAITLADIAFAAMASPAVVPQEGYPKARMPPPEEFPEPYAATLRELRAHPAGEYALRLYREERQASD